MYVSEVTYCNRIDIIFILFTTIIHRFPRSKGCVTTVRKVYDNRRLSNVV